MATLVDSHNRGAAKVLLADQGPGAMDWFMTLVGSFLGAILGIPAGFGVNKLWDAHTAKRDASQVKEAICESVRFNIALIDEIVGFVAIRGIPYSNLDLTILNATSSLKYEKLDITLCKNIDKLRYEMVDFSRSIEIYMNLTCQAAAYLVQFEGKTLVANWIPSLSETIVAKSEPIKSHATALLATLE